VLARSRDLAREVAPPVRVDNLVDFAVPDVYGDTFASTDFPKVKPPRLYNLQLKIPGGKRGDA
jgi:hypothetical protein